MKRKIVLSLFALFLFFSVGAALTILYITNTTATLSRLIELHQIELLRDGLLINLQTVQTDLYTVHTPLGQDLDRIVSNVDNLDKAAAACSSCHHNPELTKRIQEIQADIKDYESDLSFYITASADADRIEKLKMHAAHTGNHLLGLIQDMTITAGVKLQKMTGSALVRINNARLVIFITLILALFLALGVSVHLTRVITRPIRELVDASRMIASGRLGYETSYNDSTEFGELARSFNAMSAALKSGREKTDRYIEQLSGLYNITLSFYKVTEMEDVYKEICRHVADLVKVRECTLILHDPERDLFLPRASAAGLSEEAAEILSLSNRRMEEIFESSSGLPIVCNEGKNQGRFEPMTSDAMKERSVLVAWLQRKGRIVGALRVSDKDGTFTDEDAKILTILANHMAVAMENAQLYKSLQDQMSELQETQGQLIQSAKLAAIGELASNVAHEINNPLTSIIGFTELMRDDNNINSIKGRLEIIEKESIRARDIVRELLHFARKRPLQLTELDMNEALKDVIPLVESQTRLNNIVLSEDYGALPKTVGDSNQLKQVFLNIINNAVASMPGGGRLALGTLRSGNNILVRFTDTGHGIPGDVLHRIFEPFYTTKKDRGTGLGLSISYRIIQEHGGRIDVESRVGQGSIFTVRLPIKTVA